MLNVEGQANLHDVSANHINLAGTLDVSGDVVIGDKLDRSLNIINLFNDRVINLNGLTFYNLTVDGTTNTVDFVTHKAGTFTFSKAGFYKVNGHVGVRSLFYNARIMCRLKATINNVNVPRFPIGYGYIRGNAQTVSRCSCDIVFCLNDVMRFELQQAKDTNGNFGVDMLNTRLDIQSVIFEYLGHNTILV